MPKLEDAFEGEEWLPISLTVLSLWAKRNKEQEAEIISLRNAYYSAMNAIEDLGRKIHADRD